MISGEEIDVPEKKNFNPDELGKGKSLTSLVSFELLNSELGDRSYSSTSITKDIKKRIVKGYSANDFIDTVETIKTYVSAGKNILQLYSFAYGDIPENRFIFSDDLKYINSYTPDNLYTVNFSVSNLLGDFNTILKRQLNTNLGLESEIVEKDTTVLILKKIEVNGKSVKLMDPQKGKLVNNFITVDSFAISGNQIDSYELVKTLEAKTKFPVELEEPEDTKYEINMSLKSKTDAIEEWLTLFKREGFDLVMEKRPIKFIRIRKMPVN